MVAVDRPGPSSRTVTAIGVGVRADRARGARARSTPAPGGCLLGGRVEGVQNEVVEHLAQGRRRLRGPRGRGARGAERRARGLRHARRRPRRVLALLGHEHPEVRRATRPMRTPRAPGAAVAWMTSGRSTRSMSTREGPRVGFRNLMDHAVEAIHLLDDDPEELAWSGRRRWPCPGSTTWTAPLMAPEGVADLVSQARRHLTQGREPLPLPALLVDRSNFAG